MKGEKSVDEGQYAEASPAGWAGLWSAVRPAEAPHPVDQGELGEYAVLLQRDGPAGAARALPGIAAHLETRCATCAADLEELVAFLEEERRVAMAAPTAGAGAGGLRRVIATLLGSPSRPPAGAALRGGAAPAVTYQTDDVSLTLRLGPGTRPGTASLKGLVVPRHGGPAALAGGQARLLALDEASVPSAHYTAGVDDLGNFVLEGVALGAYRLELHLTSQVVVVDGLQTGRDHDPSTA